MHFGNHHRVRHENQDLLEHTSGIGVQQEFLIPFVDLEQTIKLPDE